MQTQNLNGRLRAVVQKGQTKMKDYHDMLPKVATLAVGLCVTDDSPSAPPAFYKAVFFPEQSHEHDAYHDLPTISLAGTIATGTVTYMHVICEIPRGYSLSSDEYGYPAIYKGEKFISKVLFGHGSDGDRLCFCEIVEDSTSPSGSCAKYIYLCDHFRLKF